MARIAVLGASGWLGSAVVSQLAARPNIEVLAPGRDEFASLPTHLLREMLAPAADLSVINCVGVIRGGDDAIEAANLTFVQRLCDALADSEAHLVQIGSAAEYGDPGSADPIGEDRTPEPVTHYGRTKLLATQIVRRRADWTVVRPFNGIDAEMTPINPLREIRDKVRASVEHGGPVELWSASTIRDHVSRAFLARSLAAAAVVRPDGVFNLCSGNGLSYREVAEAMGRACGTRLRIDDLERETGIPAVVGAAKRWEAVSGLSERLDADQVARLVMAG